MESETMTGNREDSAKVAAATALAAAFVKETIACSDVPRAR